MLILKFFFRLLCYFYFLECEFALLACYLSLIIVGFVGKFGLPVVSPDQSPTLTPPCMVVCLNLTC